MRCGECGGSGHYALHCGPPTKHITIKMKIPAPMAAELSALAAPEKIHRGVLARRLIIEALAFRELAGKARPSDLTKKPKLG